MKYLFSFSFLFLVVFGLHGVTTPAHAQVAGFSEPTLRIVDDKLAVFTTTRAFAVNDSIVSVPVFGSIHDNGRYFGYEILADGDVTETPSFAFALAETPIINGSYRFGPDERVSFTVVILVPLSDATATYSAAITSWPLTSIEAE